MFRFKIILLSQMDQIVVDIIKLLKFLKLKIVKLILMSHVYKEYFSQNNKLNLIFHSLLTT
jgi:hypothetical protein